MSTTLAARYSQDRPHAIVIGAKGQGRIVDQNSSKSVNSRPHANSTTNTDHYFQSSMEVSYQNEQHAHQYVPYIYVLNIGDGWIHRKPLDPSGDDVRFWRGFERLQSSFSWSDFSYHGTSVESIVF